MKIKKSKKGSIFHPLMVFVTLITLSFALFMLDTHHKDLLNDWKFMGQKSEDIIDTYQKGEKLLFYVDMSAKLSADKAIYDLGQHGGFVKRGECLSLNEISLWQRGAEECYPDFNKNFNVLFNQNMAEYLKSYPQTTELNISSIHDYETVIYNKHLIGTYLSNIYINIYGQPPNPSKIGEYETKPSFNIPFDFNLNQYKTIIESAKNIFGNCNSSLNIQKCVTDTLQLSDYIGWEFYQYTSADYPGFTSIDKLFFFDVTTHYNVPLLENKKLTEKPVIIKFALFFG